MAKTEAAPRGPRLSDQEFFTRHLELTRAGLKGIPAAVAGGNLAEARRLFAADVRRWLQPERFFSIPRTYRRFQFLRPGESEAAAVERILSGEFISAGVSARFAGEVDYFANPAPGDFPEWTWQFNRHPEWAVLAEHYRKSGDERCALAIVRMFQVWVRQSREEPLDATPTATKAWRSIDCGNRMNGSWPWALHAIYQSKHFTDDVMVDWFKSLCEHGRRLRHYHYTQNWVIIEMNGLAQIGILHPQLQEAAEWKRYALATLAQQFEIQVCPDGWQYELSTHTHQNMIRHIHRVWDLAGAYDEPVPVKFAAGLQPMHAVNVKLMMPDGRLPDLNDGAWHDVADLLDRAVDRFPARTDFRWSRDRSGPTLPPAETSVAFPQAGYFVMRSDWSREAVWALFDGGPLGYTHHHEDKLNLLLHAHGRLLLTECGNYAFDDSAMRRYAVSTRGHNTVRVDGMDQNRRRNFRKANVNVRADCGADWSSDADRDIVEAVYDEGYGPEAVRTVRHRRRVAFFKRGIDDRRTAPCFLVTDWLEPNDDAEHSYELLWHLNTGRPLMDGLVVRSNDHGESNLVIVVECIPGLVVEVVSGVTEPEWQGWHSTGERRPGDYEAIPTVICRWRGAGPVSINTLLHPLRPGDDTAVGAEELLAALAALR